MSKRLEELKAEGVKEVFVLVAKTVDGAAIYFCSSEDEAKEIWCFWNEIYAIDLEEVERISTLCKTFHEWKEYLKVNHVHINT